MFTTCQPTLLAHVSATVVTSALVQLLGGDLRSVDGQWSGQHDHECDDHYGREPWMPVRSPQFLPGGRADAVDRHHDQLGHQNRAEVGEEQEQRAERLLGRAGLE